MIVSLIVAAGNNNAIGKDNQLLWHLPKDLQFFKQTTWAMPVVMGRKTFESLGGKPLNGRINIIITRQTNWSHEGVVVVHSLADAIFYAKESDYKEVFIAGGGEIYAQALPKANKIFLTRVDATIDGDTFFPEIDSSDWALANEVTHAPHEKHAFGFSFQTWLRK
ncbi:MAG: dihydrofolate reductase [Bacteroidetes bacterium]|nr:dihydrofolate reductase [Bacteroidota bacterium]